MSDASIYPGSELELFQHARNWKAYLADRLRPYLKGEIAEIGAGLGATTRALCGPEASSWLCLEPDRVMAQHLGDKIDAGQLPSVCRAVRGTLADLSEESRFDTILYVDVLEHIDDDSAELDRAVRRLKTGGFLVVHSPAYQWLFSPYDRAIGHFRRYSRHDAARLAPSGLHLEVADYMDSAGLAASFANKALLRSSMPSQRQVLIWDRCLVPLSRPLDRLAGGRFGRSILFVWRKPPSP